MASQDPLEYATPMAQRRHPIRRWLARRAATSGQRLIALGVMAFVGLTCMSPVQNNVQLWNWGGWIFEAALVLFAIEYLLSFLQ